MMSPQSTDHFMRQILTSDFTTDRIQPQSTDLDFTIFFDFVIFPISAPNEEVRKVIQPGMTFDECLNLSEKFIDNHLTPLKSNSIIFHQKVDKSGDFFDITLNGLIRTISTKSAPVPINEASFKVIKKSAKGKKGGGGSVRVNFGNDSDVLTTKVTDELTSLLKQQRFDVITVLNSKEVEYDRDSTTFI